MLVSLFGVNFGSCLVLGKKVVGNGTKSSIRTQRYYQQEYIFKCIQVSVVRPTWEYEGQGNKSQSTSVILGEAKGVKDAVIGDMGLQT